MEENKYVSAKIRSLVLLVAFTGIMLIVSTYAWLSAQKNVTISNIEGTVNIAEGLEISLDALHWSQYINFEDYTTEELKKQYGETEHNIIPEELIPVSTTGKTGTGNTIGGTDLIMYRGINEENIKLRNIQSTDKTVTAPSNNQYPGYYAIDFFLRNSSQETGEEVLQLNVDSLVALKAGGVYTTGLQNTVRVAFALYDSTTNGDTASVDIVSTQEQILAATTGSATIKDVAIWEPNASDHVDYIVTNNNNITWKAGDKAGYIADQTTGKFTRTERIPTYALMSTAVGKEYADIYKWDGTVEGLEKQITLQTDNLEGSYKIAGGIQNLISVNSTETALYKNSSTGTVTEFKIPKNQVCRLRMYIWLEGQDVDCTSYASHGGGIAVDVGLIKGATVGTSETPEEQTGYVSPSEIFDQEGTNTEGLHIGDFVNYDAGTWTQSEIDAIQTGLATSLVTANGSTSLPSTKFQFGGFAAGSSRNGNATPYSSSYNYVKDASTGNVLTGWRVFDIDGDSVTLISAGNPEDYYHYWDGDNDGYVSEYILSGNVNSSWSTSEASNYQKRNWSNYINTNQKAQSATVLTKSRLDSWYGKYIESGADTWDYTSFRKIYAAPYLSYQSVVDNYSYYWLSAAHNALGVYFVNPRRPLCVRRQLCVWRACPSFSIV